jgi:hypothetical protein
MPVPAVVVALTGHKDIYVKVGAYDAVYSVHGSRVRSSDPNYGHRVHESIEDTSTCLRRNAQSDCRRHLPCGGRARPRSAAGRFSRQ